MSQHLKGCFIRLCEATADQKIAALWSASLDSLISISCVFRGIFLFHSLVRFFESIPENVGRCHSVRILTAEAWPVCEHRSPASAVKTLTLAQNSHAVESGQALEDPEEHATCFKWTRSYQPNRWASARGAWRSKRSGDREEGEENRRASETGGKEGQRVFSHQKLTTALFRAVRIRRPLRLA
jgi:hypothetical protein